MLPYPSRPYATSSDRLTALSTTRISELLAPITVPYSSSNRRFINWGRTFFCEPVAVFEPENESQCQLILELARREGRRVRFAGVGHSPSDLACTKEYMLRTTKLNRVLEIDTEKCTATAQGGIILQHFHDAVGKHGLALSNCGSISDQTLAGIITTATHGTGIGFGVMSTMVLSLTLMLADGTKVTCSANDNQELFNASLCGLGATGLILSAKLQLEPAFRLKEVQNTIEFDAFINEFDDLITSAEHVRMWWFPQSGLVRTSVANRTSENPNPAGSWLWHRFFGYHVVQFLLFLGRFWLQINTWTGLFAEWLIRGHSVGIDDSYRILNVDCRYPQYTTEWAIPLENATQCLSELRTWLENEYADPDGIRPHFPIEIRFSDADDIWLSPSYGHRMCWIGLIQFKPYGFIVPYSRFFGAFEAIATRLGGRPHWAKTHPFGPKELRATYPKFPDFVKVLENVDPSGLFRGEYVRRHIFGEETEEVNPRVFKPRRRLFARGI